MTISVDWAMSMIYVQKSDMTVVQQEPEEFRSLSVDQFRKDLRALEASEGQMWPTTHKHDTQSQMSGVVYARKVEILDPYKITFQEGNYAVLLVGANNNILDKSVLNGVSIRPNNSAGLQIVETGITGLSDNESMMFSQMWQSMCGSHYCANPKTGKAEVWNTEGVKVMEGDLWEDYGMNIPYRGRGIARRGPLMPVGGGGM